MAPTTPIVDRWTQRSGVRIRFLGSSPGEAVGLPVLLSPGFTDFADECVNVPELFAPRRVLAVEVRGRGGSEAPPTGYAAADHKADLRAVVDEAGLEAYHRMTFSRGTTWGLDLALAEPGRVASVSIGDYWAGEEGFDAAVADDVMTTRIRGRPLVQRVAAHVPRELFAASRDRDLLGALADTGLPVLVATGTEPGCLLTPAELEEYRRRLPGVEVVVIDGASHDLFHPNRLAYARAVREFIERHS